MPQISIANYASVGQDGIVITKIVSRNRIPIAKAAVMRVMKEESVVVGCSMPADAGDQAGCVPFVDDYYVSAV